MFEECEIYYYNGLFLDEDEMKKLHIQKANGIGLIATLQNCTDVFGLDEGELLDIDKDILLRNALSSGEDFFYTVRNKALILVPIKSYYGIKQGEQVLALYENKQIRDVKLSIVLQYDVRAITEDMVDSNSRIKEFDKQMQIKKTYDSLTFRI